MRLRGSGSGCSDGLVRDAELVLASVRSVGAQVVCDMDAQVGGKPDLGVWPRHLRPTATMDQSVGHLKTTALEDVIVPHASLQYLLKQRVVDAVPAVVRRPAVLDQGQGLDEVASSSKDLCSAYLVAAAS